MSKPLASFYRYCKGGYICSRTAELGHICAQIANLTNRPDPAAAGSALTRRQTEARPERGGEAAVRAGRHRRLRRRRAPCLSLSERDGHQDGGSLWDGRGNGSCGLASTLQSSTPSRRSSEPPLRLRRPALHRRRQRGELPRPPPACHQRRHGLLRVGRGVGEQLPARPPVAGKQKRAEVWRAVDRSVVLLRRDDSGVVPELQGGKRRQGLTAGNAQQALRGCKSRAK